MRYWRYPCSGPHLSIAFGDDPLELSGSVPVCGQFVLHLVVLLLLLIDSLLCLHEDTFLEISLELFVVLEEDVVPQILVGQDLRGLVVDVPPNYLYPLAQVELNVALRRFSPLAQSWNNMIKSMEFKIPVNE